MSGRNVSPETLRAGGRHLGFGISGPVLTEDEKEILGAIAPAAIILFARNVESASQLRDLVASIRQVSNPAPVFMIDEEGGRVDRLRSLVPGIPAAEDLASCEDPEVSRQLGHIIGSLLAEFDIEVNLAPVVDLWREGRSPSLVRRCFGTDPIAVADRAGAFIDGMASMGVLSCLKHFPGLGVATTDPHHATSVVDLSFEELEALDLAPYRVLGNAAPAVMVGHGIYPQVDADALPGTLSRTISTGLLRERLGFEGLSVTDDMEMHAVSDLASAADIAERSVIAGNDLVLFCSRLEDAMDIATRLGNFSTSDAGSTTLGQARSRVDRFVRQCGAWADRRERARQGLDSVVQSVAGLRRRLELPEVYPS